MNLPQDFKRFGGKLFQNKVMPGWMFFFHQHLLYDIFSLKKDYSLNEADSDSDHFVYSVNLL